MGRKKKEEKIQLSDEELSNISQQYVQLIEEDVKYSLDVDPEDKYNMQPLQKTFVHYYTETKSLPLAAKFTGIDEETATAYFAMYSTQQEIRRINLAMYQRQFARKMLTLDQIGGYLTSLLVDEDVPLADRLHTKDKLSVAKMLVDLNVYRKESLVKPTDIIDFTSDEEEQIKQLSVTNIKKMLAELKNGENNDEERLKLIEELKEASPTDFTVEEEMFLKSLSINELTSLLNTIKGGQQQ